MFPVLFHVPTPWGSIPMYSYGATVALGFLGAYLYTCRLAARRDIDEERITDLFIVTLVAAVIGARLNFVLTRWGLYAANPAAVVKIWEGGMVYLGGVAGAMLAGFGYLRWNALPMGVFFDMFAPAIPFACALGRLGCLLNGCCFGVACNLPWAFVSPHSSGAAMVPRHPTQIYEMLALIAVGFLVKRHYERNTRPGMTMVVLGYLYSLERFVIEFFREESLAEHYLLGLTLAQSTCLVIAAVAAACHVRIARASARLPGGG